MFKFLKFFQSNKKKGDGKMVGTARENVLSKEEFNDMEIDFEIKRSGKGFSFIEKDKKPVPLTSLSKIIDYNKPFKFRTSGVSKANLGNIMNAIRENDSNTYPYIRQVSPNRIALKELHRIGYNRKINSSLVQFDVVVVYNEE